MNVDIRGSEEAAIFHHGGTETRRKPELDFGLWVSVSAFIGSGWLFQYYCFFECPRWRSAGTAGD
jgi:hypothetical protein